MSLRRNGRLAVLNVLLSITETSGAYYQHCLGVADRREITICTYFKSNIRVPDGIRLFQGDDTLLGFFRALRAALRADEYDIVHAHSPHVGLLFVLLDILLLGRFVRLSVYNVQNSYQNYKLRNKLLMLPVFAYFRRVVCCSQACYESFPRIYRWLGGDRLRVVANGLDIGRADRILTQNPRTVHDEIFRVVSVGRLIEIKNPHAILRAFAQAGGAAGRLAYIGEGHLLESLRAEAGTLGLAGRAEFTGLIPRDQVFQRLSNADLVISASRGEGLPVAVIEAMACRCPVILSDIEPHREIAEGASFIPLVAPDDVAGLARAIERFRQMPAAERAAVGERCRQLVEQRYSLEAMHKGYEAVYAQVFERPQSGEAAA